MSEMRVEIMRKILSCFVIILISFSAMADHHGEKNADLYAAIQAFDHAYAITMSEFTSASMPTMRWCISGGDRPRLPERIRDRGKWNTGKTR